MSFPIIQTPRLQLRQIGADDLEHIYRGLSHPEVIRYYGVSYHSREATRVQMEWFAELEAQNTGIWWAICSLAEGTFYGACGFNDWEHEHRKAEIGYWLLPEYWRQGIITEAVPAICRYAFEEMGLHRIEAYVEEGNQGSEAVLAKLRFRHEGSMIDYEMKNGQFINVDIYALLNLSS